VLYTAAMARSCIAQLGLVLALVFAQALYTGHESLQHNSVQVDCQICLQASLGGDAPPTCHTADYFAGNDQPRTIERTLPTVITSHPVPPPARAPPVSLI